MRAKTAARKRDKRVAERSGELLLSEIEGSKTASNLYDTRRRIPVKFSMLLALSHVEKRRAENNRNVETGSAPCRSDSGQ